ncbi:MAG: cytochrome c oxidase subunit II [Thermus sp.]|uniref:cytochrome c oxidase subunit II n=1 Tax=Thermus sp. TaxID=275 RepID=UPI003320F498
MRKGISVLLGLGLALAEAGHRVGVLNPATSFNREVSWLLIWVLVFAVLIFGVVAGSLTYIALRFRAKGNEVGEPPQIHGNDRLEVIWTAIPIVIVLILFGLTAKSLVQVNKAVPGAFTVEVTGYQFWWDFTYPGLGLRTSNELILPVGVPVQLEVTSGDVIHSFWVPGLSGKQDAIPGQKNRIHFTPEKPGNYYGVCAELCGASHARMLFRVLVLPKEEFDRFVAEAQAYQPPVANPRGREVFQQNCAACHNATGKKPPAVIGPELAFVGNRLSLGAGIMDHTPEHLKAWIRNPAGFKPGVKMPGFPQLSEADLNALVGYLEGLKLSGFDFKSLPRF